MEVERGLCFSEHLSHKRTRLLLGRISVSIAVIDLLLELSTRLTRASRVSDAPSHLVFPVWVIIDDYQKYS